MPKQKDEKTTALIIPGQAANVNLPAEIGLMADDFAMPQEEEAPLLPYISIRQKDHRDGDEAGIKWKKGWWKINRPGQAVNDIEKLKLTVLFWKRARTFFREGDEKPYCKSIDGNVGILMTGETNNGDCATCQYSKFINGDRPKCAEGRNLYSIVGGIGPAIIRLGVSSIKPWRAFDNLVGTKRIAFNGVVRRVPWFFSVIELHTEKVDRAGFDPYWVTEPIWLEFHEDKKMVDFLRDFVKQHEQYDDTARKVDLGTEDVTGQQSSSGNGDSDGELPF